MHNRHNIIALILLIFNRVYRQIIIYGTITDSELNLITDIGADQTKWPSEFIIIRNYPNPFNPCTKIKYTIPSTVISNPQRGERSHNSNLEISPSGRNDNVNVSLKVYDILGRELATLVNQNQKPGDYEVVWDASTQPTGVYFYQLMADEYVEIKQMLLLK